MKGARLYARVISDVRTYPSPAHNRQALQLIASGAVQVTDLITHHLPLDDILEAIEIVAPGEAIKVTIEP